MSWMTASAAAIFLPLFPLSAAFVALFVAVPGASLRSALLLLWPQIGVSLLFAAKTGAPTWLAGLALFTAALYALRAVSLREMTRWIAYLATSAWSLLWCLALFSDVSAAALHLYALGFSVPLVLGTLLAGHLERQFGAAYTGLYGGLAQVLPRFSAVLVFVVLATIATPLFPGFVAMLATVVAGAAATPALAAAAALVWLLWTWAGIRLLHGLVIGPAGETQGPDLGRVATWGYAIALVLLFAGGIYAMGELQWQLHWANS